MPDTNKDLQAKKAAQQKLYEEYLMADSELRGVLDQRKALFKELSETERYLVWRVASINAFQRQNVYN